MKQTITRELVKKIADLAHLELSDADIDKYRTQFEGILAYFDETKQLSLESIAETSRVTDEVNVVREDKVGTSFTQEEALHNASKKHNGYFVVPYVLTQKDSDVA